MTVTITPLPSWARKMTRFRPLHPPVFEDDNPTPDEIELALALFAELDDASQHWYGQGFSERLRRARLASAG